MHLHHKTYKDYSRDEIDRAFLHACTKTELELAHFLLTDYNLRYRADIHAYKDNAFREACKKDNVEVVKFLLFSPKLHDHVDIHIQDDAGFRLAIINKSFNVLEYFIIDLNIEKTENIKQHLINNPGSEAIRLFELRDLNKQLNQELSSGQVKRQLKL